MSKTVFKNTFHYGAVQLLSYIMPLILVPYISRVIGIERYGITEFSVEIAMFFGTVLLFGYDFTMSRRLSQYRNDHEVVNGLFWNVFYSRLLLSSVILPLFVAAGLFFLSELFTLEIIGYCTLFVMSRIFSSWWFFQGMEKIKWIAWGNLTAKLVLLVLILSLVREESDYPFVVLGYASSQFAVNAVSWYALIHLEKLKAIQMVVSDIMHMLKDSFYVFLNEFAIVGFTALNLFLVKQFLSPKELGVYVSAMKVVAISQNLVIQSLSKSLFPNLAYTLHHNKENYLILLKRFRNYLGGFLLVLGLGILLFRDLIVYLLYGPAFEEVSSYLVYVAFLPFLKGITNIHGWQGLYVMEKERTMASITLSVGIGSLILLLLVIPEYGVTGVLIVRNIHEMMLMFLTALYFNKLWKKENQ